jgi:probable HAF family extracellular repeat protein
MRTSGWVRIGGELTFITLPGFDTQVSPTGVSSSGTVVGQMSQSDLSGSPQRAFRWTPDAGLTDLAVADPGTHDAWATAVNEAGQVVGQSYPRDRQEQVTAFLWEDGAVTTLAPPAGATWAGAYDVNDAGQVGGFGRRADGGTVAVLWEPPAYAPVVLPAPAGPGLPAARAVAIDADGSVVGWSDPFVAQSFRWASGAGHPVTVITGMVATDIDGGDVVGYVPGDQGRADRPVILEAGESAIEDLGGPVGQATAKSGGLIVGASGRQPATFLPETGLRRPRSVSAGLTHRPCAEGRCGGAVVRWGAE